jgi:hypothetical protein
MKDRYPFIRFVVDSAPVIAGAVALVVFFAGTMSACRQGGFGGLVGFLLVVILAAAAYVAVMVRVESLKVLLDIEDSGRERLAELRRQAPPAQPERT